MKHLIFVCTLFLSFPLWSQLRSPDNFLPHRLGEAFTPHFMLVDYVEHVAAESERVQLQQYGTTNEGRPLLLAVISSPENLERLKAIRSNNLRRTGLLDGPVDTALDRSIVWLSFSVHGNEAAGSEAAKEVLYRLADPDNERTGEWLENTVVLLDPSVNPDGYDRYTSWHRRVANRRPDPHAFTREHDEPWPGGRTNHYLFDLNRDWAWQTQVESQARIRTYRQWMPHIHADLHEMGPNSPYYFAPAARPYHAYITDFQERFQEYIGKNHAGYFDANGWLYFTREVYDLLYPSYGDTWPSFNGAIGMTYEQGGSGRAGRALILDSGDTLSLKERIDHHITTALSTVEVASERSAELLQGFATYFQTNLEEPRGPWLSYLIKADQSPERLQALLDLLDRNGIYYGHPIKEGRLNGWNYALGRETSFEVLKEDILITAHQPNGALAQVLLDPIVEVEDSLTYDITAWALPYVYGLEAAAFDDRLNDWIEPYRPATTARSRSATDAPDFSAAWLAPWNAVAHARLLADLLQEGLKVRTATRAFGLQGQEYEPGTLVITRADNQQFRDLDQLMRAIQGDYPDLIRPVLTGLTETGPDLGSRAFRLLDLPRIGVMSGEGIFSNSFGQVWHYFETVLQMPVHVLSSNEPGRVPLEDLDLLILPEGRYEINDPDPLNEWIAAGGRLIAIGYANRSLEGVRGFDLLRAEAPGPEADNDLQPSAYGSARRQAISRDIPGAVFRLDLDHSHPLAYGLPEHYFSLKTSSLAYAPLDRGWNVGVIGPDPYYQGFVGANALDRVRNSMVFGVQDKGRGAVIYLADNPLFRGFWEVGKQLFANAVFMVR